MERKGPPTVRQQPSLLEMDLEIEKQEDVTVFWDFSSTQNSSAAATISTAELVKNICSAVGSYGPLRSIQVYWDYAAHPIQSAATRIRSELSASGVCLIDCPSECRKDGAMKKMLVDLLIHAWDHEADPHTYVIIATDRDVAYALSRLRMKEYRIILLSPAMTHSDLTSQASVRLDWSRSVLGLTGPSYHPNFEDTPATSSCPPSTAPGNQPFNPSRLRRETLSSVYQESDEPPLPNPHDLPPGRHSSSPFLPKSHDNGRGPALAPQIPPRASAWSMPGDFHAAKPASPNLNSGNPMPSGRTSMGFSGVSTKPLSFSGDTLRPPETTFSELPSLSQSGKNKTRLESVESGSSDETRFSFVKPQTLSTAPTSAEEERKPDRTEPQPQTGSNSIDLGQADGNVAIPGPEEAGVQTDSRPIQTSRLPALAPIPNVSRPTTTTAIVMPSFAVPKTPQPSRSASVASTRIWDPLICTLRGNDGVLSYTALPPKLLKSYPDAYALAGCSKYKQYIQKAVESGIVDRVEEDPTYPCIQLTDVYM